MHKYRYHKCHRWMGRGWPRLANRISVCHFRRAEIPDRRQKSHGKCVWRLSNKPYNIYSFRWRTVERPSMCWPNIVLCQRRTIGWFACCWQWTVHPDCRVASRPWCRHSRPDVRRIDRSVDRRARCVVCI